MKSFFYLRNVFVSKYIFNILHKVVDIFLRDFLISNCKNYKNNNSCLERKLNISHFEGLNGISKTFGSINLNKDYGSFMKIRIKKIKGSYLEIFRVLKYYT